MLTIGWIIELGEFECLGGVLIGVTFLLKSYNVLVINTFGLIMGAVVCVGIW